MSASRARATQGTTGFWKQLGGFCGARGPCALRKNGAREETLRGKKRARRPATEKWSAQAKAVYRKTGPGQSASRLRFGCVAVGLWSERK